jgi:death on curing protein
VAEVDPGRRLSVADVLGIHRLVIEHTGYAPAPLRDEGLLESAVMRARNAAYYEGADVIRQSAFLAIGISQAQAFLDGNKRTAFAAADTFLRLNGLAYADDPLLIAERLEAVAAGEGILGDTVDQFEAWLRPRVGAVEKT